MTMPMTRRAAALVTGALAVIVLAPPAAAVVPSWSVQTTADPGPAGSADQLAAVSCPSATACMAVGMSVAPPGTSTSAIAEYWDGGTWAATPMDPVLGAGGELASVSCSSASSCTAVGTRPAATGVAVPVAERWNGATWTSQPLPGSPTRQILTAVSCASATACMAVGNVLDPSGNIHGLAMYWNGAVWTTEPTTPTFESPATLNAVSCVSAAACVAVGQIVAGTSETGWVERWDGTGWTGSTVPLPGSDLWGVSCTAVSACTAAGTVEPATGPDAGIDLPLIERWNGTGWAEQYVPRPPGTIGTESAGARPATGPGHGPLPTDLDAVSCTSATSCVTVGSFGDLTGGTLPLAESWDGAQWTLEYPPYPAPATVSTLAGVSCRSAAVCAAVGSWDAWTAATQGFYPIGTLAEGSST